MLSKNLQELKVSLNEAIGEWMESNSSEDGWEELGYIGDYASELMTDAAFAVLIAGKDVNDYLEKEGHLKA